MVPVRRPPDVWATANELRLRGEPFVLATVVGRRRPTSGQLGYKAVVRPDGSYVGWVGGACSEHILVTEALAALRAGEPRKIRISPDEDEPAGEDGTVQRRMECKSGGTVEIYIEPNLPRPTLVSAGDTPIALSVASLGPLLGYHTVLIAPGTRKDRLPDVDEVVTQVDGLAEKLPPPTFGVVATMGKFDESALQELLKARAVYVGLVASRTRSATVLATLRRRKVDESDIQRIKTPAGLDIAAKTPEEVAVSIIAEITQARRTRVPADAVPLGVPVGPSKELFEDPVCHMQVEASTPLRSVHQGKTYYFCSESCVERFTESPGTFLPKRSGAKTR
jgi:xanthine dehydrogenase accessory factor